MGSPPHSQRRCIRSSLCISPCRPPALRLLPAPHLGPADSMIEPGLPVQIACSGSCWRTVRCSSNEFERGVLSRVVACPLGSPRSLADAWHHRLDPSVPPHTSTCASQGARDTHHLATCVFVSRHRTHRAKPQPKQSCRAAYETFNWQIKVTGNGQASLEVCAFMQTQGCRIPYNK